MSDEWSINTEDWAIADEDVYVENPEFVYVKTDSEDKILEGIKTDGTKVFGGDVQIGGNTTISGDATILGKVDIQGATYTLQENPEWTKVLTDSQDRIIAGVKKDGSVYCAAGFETTLAYIKELTFDNAIGQSATLDTLYINTQLNLSNEAKKNLQDEL